MAPKKEALADNLAVQPVNGGEDKVVLAAFTGLIDSVKILSSQDSYKLVDGLLDKIEHLQKELTTKEEDFAAHTYLTTILGKELSSLQNQVGERDRTIEQLTKDKADLKKKVQKLEENLKQQDSANKKARGEIKEQREKLKTKDERIRELEDKFGRAHERELQLKQDLDSLKTKHGSLIQEHDVIANKLQEFEGFAISLSEYDSKAVWVDLIGSNRLPVRIDIYK